MVRHFILVSVAIGIGILVGSLGQIGLKLLAILSLIGGPGLYEGMIALADRPDLFWIVSAAAAAVVGSLIYLVWGTVWLVRRQKHN
jgi:hypothetical protein